MTLAEQIAADIAGKDSSSKVSTSSGASLKASAKSGC